MPNTAECDRVVEVVSTSQNGSFVDAIFTLAGAEDGDVVKSDAVDGALQAMLARRMRMVLRGDGSARPDAA